MRAFLLRGIAALAVLATIVLPARAQPGITVTPTLVSVQLGLPLYCAAKWTSTAATIQLYCYTTRTTTWDTLIYNSIFPISGAQLYVPYVSQSANAQAGIIWIFRRDPTTNVVTWEVGWSGTNDQKGTFQ